MTEAYDALKATTLSKFGGREPELESVLADYCDDPNIHEQRIEEAFQHAGVDRDQEVIDQAAQLLKLLEDARPGITGGLVGQIYAQGGNTVVVKGDVGAITFSDVAAPLSARSLPSRERYLVDRPELEKLGRQLSQEEVVGVGGAVGVGGGGTGSARACWRCATPGRTSLRILCTFLWMRAHCAMPSRSWGLASASSSTRNRPTPR